MTECQEVQVRKMLERIPRCTCGMKPTLVCYKDAMFNDNFTIRCINPECKTRPSSRPSVSLYLVVSDWEDKVKVAKT
jgi:hypothetical protein